MSTESRCTLFAGAGFSTALSRMINYHDGKNLIMPLAHQILSNQSAYDYFDPKKFPNHDYDKLGTYLEVHYGNRNPSVNYETVYGHLEEIQSPLATTLENLVFEVLGVNFPPIRYSDEVRQTIEIGRKWLCKNKISQIITTNPDILLDIIIAGSTEFDINFLNLFEGFSKQISIIRSSGPIDLEPVLSAHKGFGKLDSIERFIKLHGSITMAKKDKKFYWQNKYMWKNGISSNVYTHNNEYELCVVPPSPAKKYNVEPWKGLFDAAALILKNTQNLIFFGFGFAETDRALSEKLRENIKNIREIAIYQHPEPNDDNKEKAKTFLGLSDRDLARVKFFPSAEFF